MNSVYWMQVTDHPDRLIKIGFSANLHKRRLEVERDVPCAVGRSSVVLLASVEVGSAGMARALEVAYHRRFSSCHESGEWFRPSRNLLKEIAAVNNGNPSLVIRDTPANRLRYHIAGEWAREDREHGFALTSGALRIRIFEDGSWGLYRNGLLVDGDRSRYLTDEQRANNIQKGLFRAATKKAA